MKKAEKKRLTLMDNGWYNSYPMKNHRVLTLITILAIITPIILFSSVRPCFAAFSMTVEPYEGGYDLRFGRIDTQDVKVVKEVTFTITTTIDKQYRVYQRLEKPFTTPDGIEIDKNQFKMYTLINSNSLGILERLEEFPVMYGDTVLYTSNTAGGGDSFRIVYTIDPSMNQVEGSYYGRMIYILRPIDSTQDEVTVTLQMYVDFTNEGSIEVTTESGFNSIRISSIDLNRETFKAPVIYINVNGNLGSTYRIYQKLNDTLIKSEEGDLFDLQKVEYKVTDINSGAVVKNGDLTELKIKSLVYTSDDLGLSNNIAIEYTSAQDFTQQKAGTYRGTINYYLELEDSTSLIESGLVDYIDAEFEVEPIFRIIATSITEEGEVVQEGGAQLQFGDVSYKTGPKESRVRIEIESNLEKPYLVSQKLTGILENDEGYVIPKELFTFELEKAGDIDTGAKLKFEEEAIVDTEGDVTLFISNTNGDSDEFEVIYSLKTTRDTRGGSYSTGLSYYLGEL